MGELNSSVNVSMFHNPKCSKSRATLKLLNDRGIEPEIILYLKDPPTEKTISEIREKLDIEPKELIRFKESRVKELGLSQSDTRSDREWIKLMVENPILIERPIVFTSNKAAIGRPPENVLELFDK